MAAIAGCVVSTSVFAAGFDCAKATSSVERQICGDAALSALDSQVGAAYRQVLSDAPNAAAWRADQRNWIAERNRCTTSACLRDQYVARLTLLKTPQGQSGWAGKWWRIDNTGFTPSVLTIDRVGDAAFAFTFEAATGANSGTLDGTAKRLDGAMSQDEGPASEAARSMPDTSGARVAHDAWDAAHVPSGEATLPMVQQASYRGKAPVSAGCDLTFAQTLNRIVVTQHGGDAECGAGHNVGYAGIYVRSSVNPNPKPDLQLLGVFATQAQDQAFRAMVGTDYDNFVDVAHGIGTDSGVMNGRPVRITQMFVEGVACTNKAVLISDGQGHQWAAVWVFGASEKDPMQVRYYTNVPADAGRLPDVIAESVHQTCSDVTVRYMNR